MNIFIMVLILFAVIMIFYLIDLTIEGELINIYRKYKEHIYITSSILLVILMLLVIRLLFAELDEFFWLSMIPNLITDLLGIIVATYIINILLKKKQERDEKSKAYKMVGGKFEALIFGIANMYINLLTRESIEWKKEGINTEQAKGKIEQMIKNIYLYIDEDFLIQKVAFTIYNPNNKSIDLTRRFETHVADRVDYVDYFISESTKDLNTFITKYISVLPEELRELLFLLENNFQSNVLTSPKKLDIFINLHSIKIDVEDFKNCYTEIGSTLIRLSTYFDERK